MMDPINHNNSHFEQMNRSVQHLSGMGSDLVHIGNATNFLDDLSNKD
jgi:hypothetical protein